MFCSAAFVPVAFAMLVCTLSLSAQRPVDVPTPDSKARLEASSTGRVTLDVVVEQNSHHDQPVAGLTQQDFTLTDNKAPRPIVTFNAVTAAQSPVEVTLVIDSVNASYTLVSFARQEVSRFLRSNDGHLAYPTRLAILTNNGMEVQPQYSQDGNVLATGLDHADIGLRAIRRAAGFYGADERMQLSVGVLNQYVKREEQRPNRKLVLFISPGWPLLAGPGVELSSQQHRLIFDQIVALSTRLRRARMTLYGVNPIGPSEDVARSFYYQQFLKGAAKPGDADLGHLSLQVLAEQSGGRFLSASNDVAAMLRSAVADASAFYELSFDAPHAEHPDEYHTVTVHLDQRGLTVRAPYGYYDQP